MSAVIELPQQEQLFTFRMAKPSEGAEGSGEEE